MSLGKRIKELRENLNVSQEEMGEGVGISGVMISMYEQDKKSPSTPTLIKIAQYLGTSTDYLLGISDANDKDMQLFLSLARDAKANGITINDIKLAIDTVKRIRGGGV